MRPSEGAGLIWGQIDVDGMIIDLTVIKTKPEGTAEIHTRTY
jgi:hypothetical protein